MVSTILIKQFIKGCIKYGERRSAFNLVQGTWQVQGLLPVPGQPVMAAYDPIIVNILYGLLAVVFISAAGVAVYIRKRGLNAKGKNKRDDKTRL